MTTTVRSPSEFTVAWLEPSASVSTEAKPDA
jgi:hypothetical protein